MALLIALALGLVAACGTWLILQTRSFPVILGIALLGHAVNLLIFMGGRTARATPPLTLPGAGALADPIPQALVLTAIVIGFGMTALAVAAAIRAHAESGSDRVDLPPDESP
jgi:multicomponent K+:H+ antiporter subunit C